MNKGQLKLENQKDYIINAINNDITLTQIAKELNSSITAVSAIITKYLPNKTFPFNRIKFYKREKEVYEKWLELDKNVDKTAKHYNCNPTSIRSALLAIEPNLTFSLDKGNVHYFNKIDSANKAYILGFIAADGSLVFRKYKGTITGNPTLTITLNKKDIDVLYFIKNEFGCEHSIKDLNNRDQVRFTITDKYLSQDLISLGVTPRKTFTLQDISKNIPKKFRKAFLLGYFDGDGCICKYIDKRPKKNENIRWNFSVRGTKELLQGYLDEFNWDLPLRKYDSTYQISTSRQQILLDFMSCYDEENSPSFFLKRKYDRFLQFKEDKIQDKTISSP